MKSGKVWGQTEPLLVTPLVELSRIMIKAGGKCSEHLHAHKFNAFYVISGRMLVHTWKNDYDLRDTTSLGPREIHVVDPTEYHQFEAVEDTEALELYSIMPLDPHDIVRRTVGSKG